MVPAGRIARPGGKGNRYCMRFRRIDPAPLRGRYVGHPTHLTHGGFVMALFSADAVTYPPLDVPKPVADRVWIVDSGPMRVLGLPLPVRMTVLKLVGGGLILHSPTRFEPNLKRALERLGPIRHLVAPNVGHRTFLKDWQRHCPEAVAWAAPGLRARGPVKASGVRLDRDLPPESPPEWAQDVEQAVVPGAAGFSEVAFFHRPSRTLALTDLVVNLEAGKLPLPARAFAWATGALAPNGKAPVYLRLIVRRGAAEAREAARRLVALDPERVIFAHGRWFERDGAAQLRRSLDWILR
jgi:hypothetical protein